APDLEAFLAERRATAAGEPADGDGGTGAAEGDRIENRSVPRPDAVRVTRRRVVRRGLVRASRAPVRLVVPQRGDRRQLMTLATRNAQEMLAREHARWLADQGKTLAALEELADALGLPGPPLRIECYDISTFQGAQTVGSMVVFEEGRPRTGEYRRFRIRTVVGHHDDFASHQEVLRRRFHRVKAGEEGSAEERRWAMPDLVIVDGGKGQVSAAKEVLDELGLHDLPVAGLAKEREELFLPDRSEPVVLPPTSPALYLVQRLRDEAHRFAITYHRDLRSKKAVRSAFDELPGVGPKRKQALLRVFGSAKRVREAPVEQIAAVPGIGRALAARIKATLEA
ncbi:MAG TPA: helix-hairpin-helix domain-containing protein, partial [Candidatus Dormibacteraeota bacterium]|nr:helix-hairpin-helix domain-containing protein [Candidatus Dormibacteraeota bacterium]